MIFDFGYYKEKVRVGSNFGSCCGSQFRPGKTDSKPERKWKNQHGEGVSPAVEGKDIPVDMVNGNRLGILLATGKQKTPDTDKMEFKNIKTKNGWITTSIRTAW